MLVDARIPLLVVGGGRHVRSQNYWMAKATDDDFPYFVSQRSEAIQLLHHDVCLVIGDAYGSVIGGIWVEYDDELKNAWGEVLKDMHYHLGIGFAYEDVAVGDGRVFRGATN